MMDMRIPSEDDLLAVDEVTQDGVRIFLPDDLAHRQRLDGVIDTLHWQVELEWSTADRIGRAFANRQFLLAELNRTHERTMTTAYGMLPYREHERVVLALARIMIGSEWDCTTDAYNPETKRWERYNLGEFKTVAIGNAYQHWVSPTILLEINHPEEAIAYQALAGEEPA